MLQRLVVPNAHGGYAKKSNVSEQRLLRDE